MQQRLEALLTLQPSGLCMTSWAQPTRVCYSTRNCSNVFYQQHFLRGHSGNMHSLVNHITISQTLQLAIMPTGLLAHQNRLQQLHNDHCISHLTHQSALQHIASATKVCMSADAESACCRLFFSALHTFSSASNLPQHYYLDVPDPRERQGSPQE